MADIQPGRSARGASADPATADPAAPGSEPTIIVGGSRRRSQWSAPTIGAQPPGDGDGQVDEAWPDNAPDEGGGRRMSHSTVVLTAVSVLVVGLLVAVASTISWRVNGSSDRQTVATSASGSSRPSPPPVPVAPGLDAATPAPSSKPSTKKTESRETSPENSITNENPGSTVQRKAGAARKAAGAKGPAPVGAWQLGSGSGSLGEDTTGAHPLKFSNVTRGSGHGGSALFDGVDSQAQTSGPVLNSSDGSSFTVSAWAYLTENDSVATVVGQDGGPDSSFNIQYSQTDNRWAFTRPGAKALSSAPPELRTWTHLVGVFDANSGNEMLLYVNGVQQGTATVSTVEPGNGPLAIGRGKSSIGFATDWFPGRINDVKVFNQALSANQVGAI